MKISHEAPRSELAFFVQAPLRLVLPDGQTIVLREWNLSGLRRPADIEIFPNRAVLVIPFQGIDIQFPVSFGAAGADGVHAFQDLTVRQKETLALFYNGILTGRMAPADQIITALDTPVDLVPMGETEEERARDGAQSTSFRMFRVLRALAIYVCAALVVFGLLGKTLAQKVSTIPVQQARVVAPEIDHVASAAAFVENILIAPGDRVVQGDIVIKMSDPRREGRLDDARRVAAAATKKLSQSRALLRQHEANWRLEQTRLHAALEAALVLQRDETAAQRMNRIATARNRLIAFQHGVSQQAGDFADQRAQLVAMRDADKEALRQAKRRVGIAKADARMLDVRAQADGVVTEIAALEDQHVARATLLVKVEETGPRHVVGQVSMAEAMGVMVGQGARVAVPGAFGPITHDAEIVDISAAQTDGFKGDGVVVTFRVPAAPRDQMRPDAPAQVRIWRSWVPGWLRG